MPDRQPGNSACLPARVSGERAKPALQGQSPAKARVPPLSSTVGVATAADDEGNGGGEQTDRLDGLSVGASGGGGKKGRPNRPNNNREG